MDKDAEQKDKRSIVIVAMSSGMLLNVTGPTDVFTNADQYVVNSGNSGGYDVKVVSPLASKQLKSTAGMTISFELFVGEIEGYIDTLIIAGNDSREASQPGLEPLYQWLTTRNEHNTRRIASICGGAFVLAKAGVLSGRKATTHWQASERLMRAYPDVKVNTNPFFSKDGHIYTSAGVSSGIDLSLALVEEDHNRDIAINVARKLVFYLSRPGFQSQFGSLLPLFEREHIGQKTQDWVGDHLSEKLDVNKVADHLNMSTRNFTRVFHRETGMPPAKFIEKLRVEAARKYLEDSDMTMERIAELCGLGGLVSMRRIFLRRLNTTPSDYRRAFRSSLRDMNIEQLLANAVEEAADTI